MNNNQGSLYIVSTPIGNLDDITFRAIEVLNKVDICASEDTRVSAILFRKYQIKTKLTSYHKFSEKSKVDDLIGYMKSGKNIALISDAGTPLISDPGHFLVDAAIKNKIRIIPIPGVTSLISALTVSGFNLDNFTFYGFFPRKLKDKRDLMKKISLSTSPSVLFESGRRLEKLFDSLLEELEENCQILVAREITKMHETFYRGSLHNIKEILSESEFGLKGEFVIVIDGTAKINKSNISEDDSRILNILMDKLDNKLALEIGSEILNKKRNQLYKIKLKD
ncbi:MAG: 16S rRNA (cytidine(1402)-2'-O)-methyltransferase [Gammaproteobacteria bacterium]